MDCWADVYNILTFRRNDNLTKCWKSKKYLILLVKTAESVPDHVFGIGSLKPLSEESEEHGEVDGAGSVAHHILQVLVGWVLAQRGQHVVKVFFIDESVTIL